MTLLEKNKLRLADAICRMLADPTEENVCDLVTTTRNVTRTSSGLLYSELRGVTHMAFAAHAEGLPPEFPQIRNQMIPAIPTETKVGNLRVLHAPEICHIVVRGPGLLVPKVLHEISYTLLSEAEAKQAEAIAWAEKNCA